MAQGKSRLYVSRRLANRSVELFMLRPLNRPAMFVYEQKSVVLIDLRGTGPQTYRCNRRYSSYIQPLGKEDNKSYTRQEILVWNKKIILIELVRRYVRVFSSVVENLRIRTRQGAVHVATAVFSSFWDENRSFRRLFQVRWEESAHKPFHSEIADLASAKRERSICDQPKISLNVCLQTMKLKTKYATTLFVPSENITKTETDVSHRNTMSLSI